MPCGWPSAAAQGSTHMSANLLGGHRIASKIEYRVTARNPNSQSGCSSSAAHQKLPAEGVAGWSQVRHQALQMFRSQFETKIHNKIRERVKNNVENWSARRILAQKNEIDLWWIVVYSNALRPSQVYRIVKRWHPLHQRLNLRRIDISHACKRAKRISIATIEAPRRPNQAGRRAQDASGENSNFDIEIRRSQIAL